MKHRHRKTYCFICSGIYERKDKPKKKSMFQHWLAELIALNDDDERYVIYYSFLVLSGVCNSAEESVALVKHYHKKDKENDT